MSDVKILKSEINRFAKACLDGNISLVKEMILDIPGVAKKDDGMISAISGNSLECMRYLAAHGFDFMAASPAVLKSTLAGDDRTLNCFIELSQNVANFQAGIFSKKVNEIFQITAEAGLHERMVALSKHSEISPGSIQKAVNGLAATGDIQGLEALTSIADIFPFINTHAMDIAFERGYVDIIKFFTQKNKRVQPSKSAIQKVSDKLDAAFATENYEKWNSVLALSASKKMAFR